MIGNTLKKILVVDDEPISLKLLIDHLEEAGFQIEQANDGQEALTKLQKHPNNFSVIVLDRIMPYMGGMELLNIIKQTDQLCNIPIIMLTGLDEKEDIIDAVKAGVFDYLTKPVEKELLLKMVHRALTE